MSNKQKKLTCTDIGRLECVCHGKLSPDEKKLAYFSNTSGTWQVFLTDAMVCSAGVPVTELECGVADYYWASDTSLFIDTVIRCDVQKSNRVIIAEALPLLDEYCRGLRENAKHRHGMIDIDSGDIAWLAEGDAIPADFSKPMDIQTVLAHNAWLREYALSKPIRLERAKAELTLPLEAGENCPALLYISEAGVNHVGGFDVWAQVMAARGYAVIRADVAKDADWCMGNESAACEFADIMAAMDEAVSCYGASNTVLAVAGEAAPYFAAHSNRFRAAISICALWNPATAYGTSFFHGIDTGRAFVDTLKERLAASILARIDDITVPMLVLHGECDTVVGMEQGEQLFHAMQDRHPDAPSRLVVFPGEGHDLIEMGRPKWRICFIEEMLTWLDKYLVKNSGEDE